MADIYGEGSNSKKQWDKLKGAPMKDKVKYIAQYYGIAILAVVVGIVFIVSLVRSIIYNSIPNIISVEAYSSVLSEDVEDVMLEKLSTALQVDPSDYHIAFTSSLVSEGDIQQAYMQSQKIFARVAAGDIDAIIGKESLLISFMSVDDPESCAFSDVRTYLSDEMYERLLQEDKIVFLKGAKEELPYAVDLTGTDLAETIGLFGEGNLLAYVVTSKNADALRALSDMIYE